MIARLESGQKKKSIDNDLYPYQMEILNKRLTDDAKTEQMINWSIFSDKFTYVNSCANMNPSLTIRPLEDKKHKRLYINLKADEELIPDIIFDEDRIRDTYLDKYDGVQAEILQVTISVESTDLKYNIFR